MEAITKKEFSKNVVIYKSHKLKNGFISITYANKLSANTVSAERTVKLEDRGGALETLFENNY